MALEAGTRLGPYEILEPLGAGGMGEVYRARDPRLKRDVALKVLPAELASQPDRLARFQREAEALAALNHPQIVTIHSIEEADDLHFLTMELVEGKPLSKVIPRDGLSLPRFFRLAIPLAQAVSAAHDRRITHRDLKPGNVMVTDDDRVKVLDFGLARLRHDDMASVDTEARTATATAAGRVLGTVPYMSPEQVQGKTADHLSDVFSLGIVLYEMVTGDRPFRGETAGELAASILRDTPASVTERRADLPRDLGKIIRRCLEKDPGRRFQSTLDLANELEDLRREVDTGDAVPSAGTSMKAGPPERRLRWWLTVSAALAVVFLVASYLLTRSQRTPAPGSPPAAERKMLVVLPFENLGAPEDAYFAAGMAEEITTRLARVDGLGVISSTSAELYDRTGKTTKQIGEDLGVGFVLEGTVRWDRRSEGEGRVRITPRLIRVADDTHLWADGYDRQLDDIFAIQDDIARSVATSLRVSLLGRSTPEAARSRDLEVYNLFLQGRYLYERGGLEEIDEAISCLERAVKRDPEYARAWVYLASAHADKADTAASDLFRQAVREMERAVALEPGLADGHAGLARLVAVADWDWPRAEAHFQRALQLEPGDATILREAASLAGWLGRLEEAVALDRRAVELDPLNVRAYRRLGFHLWCAGRLEEAESSFREALKLNPDLPSAHLQIGRILLAQSQPHAALEEMTQETDQALRLYGMILVHDALGEQAEANAALSELIAQHVEPWAFQIASIHASRGEADQAFEWLERAYVLRDSGLPLIKIYPLLKPIRSDPRYTELLQRMQLPL